MDALENAGRLSGGRYKNCTIYSTLSCCPMCSGAIVLYGIPRVVVGENITFRGPEEYVKSHGVQYIVANDRTCIEMMTRFIAEKPALWNEDIGVPDEDVTG